MRKIRSLFCLGCFVFATFGVNAQAPLSPGKNFKDVGAASTPSATSANVGAANKEVAEFFMYRCPHCRTSRDEVDAWRKNLPKGTTFRRVPLVFGPLDLAHASMYYTLESLGKLEELDARVFQAVLTDKKLLSTPEEQASFFQDAGIAPEAYIKAYNSFSVKAKVSRAAREAQGLAIDAAPSLVVAGRYVTNPTLAGSASEAIRVAGSLLDRVITGDTRGVADATLAAKSAGNAPSAMNDDPKVVGGVFRP
jgi:thiol:disulfide interchange protein DsbA